MLNATSAPTISYYDYIIVGGGTAGCPLAATLSQNASVLLLERGGSPYGNPNITNLAKFGAALSDPSPTSPSQRFISEDGVINARARVLGGGSCLNAGFYTRASPEYIRYIILKLSMRIIVIKKTKNNLKLHIYVPQTSIRILQLICLRN
jgi:choline dehydrogenase